jgi:hypothetical protein
MNTIQDSGLDPFMTPLCSDLLDGLSFSHPVSIPDPKYSNVNNSETGEHVKPSELFSQALRPTQEPKQKITSDTRAKYKQWQPKVSSSVGVSCDALLITLPPLGLPLSP